MHLKEAELIL